MDQCGAAACASHTYFTPTSPLFSRARRLVWRDPSTAAPNGMESDARRTSVPAHAPASVSSGSARPSASTTSSSRHALARADGLDVEHTHGPVGR